MQRKKSINILNITLLGLLTAIVIVLQYLGQFIKLGPFSVSLVLVPIVLGAAVIGEYAGAWLGLVFGVTVLLTGDAAAFLAVSVPGTIITVLLKGILCGYVSGLVYKLTAKKNKYLSVVLSAVVCPIVNTGVFLLGCFVFFFKAVSEWAAGFGYNNVIVYMIVGLVGLNFVVEMVANIILSPVILRISETGKKMLGSKM